MITDEIVKLSRERMADLVRSRHDPPADFDGEERRVVTRWPFPGTAELRPAEGDGRPLWFATCRNVSETGLGISTDEPFEPGTPLEIAFHLPEASFYGKATVRYCTQTPQAYLVGLEFDFEE